MNNMIKQVLVENIERYKFIMSTKEQVRKDMSYKFDEKTAEYYWSSSRILAGMELQLSLLK